MAVFSTLKYALVATCAFSLTQVEGLPTASSGTSEWLSAPNNLMRRQNAIAFSGVQQGFGPAQGQVPIRKEIRQMIQSPVEFNLFVLALQRFYAQPQSSETSYYGIAGIHGRPYKAWNGVTGGRTDSGYCTHSDVLFPSWHRPYLALYEQIIWEHARNIVNEFSEPRRAAYAAVLPTLRIPYWDWAVDARMPPQVGEWVTIQVETPRGQQTIPNPLYSYQFTDLREIPDAPFNSMRETYRFPAQSSNGQYQSQPAAVNQALLRLGGNMRNRVYQLLTAYKQYNVLASKASSQSGSGQFDSLEAVHDTIHGTVGSGGHMGWVDVAAFDPIFWLHHTNIDRLFAIWQGINPTAFTISGRSSMGTYGMRPGTEENLNTPLTPFRRSGGTYYTSATSASTKSFGYAYQETADWTPNTSPSGQIANVIAAVNGLYGRGTPAMSLQEAGRIAMKKRALGHKMKRADAEPSKVLNQPPAPESLAAVESQVVESSTYNEWMTDINVNNAALNGTFNVHIFLGDFSANPEQWATDKNLVGTHTVFTTIDGVHDTLVSGSIPLTSSLLNKVVTGELENLKPETVVPFLRKSLKCRVAKAENVPVDVLDVQGLKVQVAAASVVLPQSQTELPQWGEYEIKYDVVDQARQLVA
ncbi:Tyrosinase [Dactylella cylindrospora]|nr:Tyrosinase [Dactylella cylindrospora]